MLIANLEPREARVSLRQAVLDDVPRLAALNRAAYPDLVEQNVVFSEDQLRTHLAVFPQGQRVAEQGGRVVGAIATLVVRGHDALGMHTWIGITSDGRFAHHRPSGDTLYLADIYVDQAYWGKGVGRALYGELRWLCRGLGLKRIVAGGRLWGYAEHAARLSPETYVAKVVSGELRDRVLTSQLRAGFVVRAVLPAYLTDPRSANHATLLEWVNDDAA
jgi:GNAT superfamily N-acetyltransferase